MMFEGFKDYLNEVAYGYFADMVPFLGRNTWEHLNYGGSEQFGLHQPMLYVPIQTSNSGSKSTIGKQLTRIRKQIKKRIECFRDEASFSKFTCRQLKGKLDQRGRVAHITKFMPTGETHITVAPYPQLDGMVWSKHLGRGSHIQQQIDFLKTVRLRDGTPLFTNGVGVPMPIEITEPPEILIGVAAFLENNPIVALVPVRCPMVNKVKDALELPTPTGYRVHLTIGFANAVWDKPNPHLPANHPENGGASARSGPARPMVARHNMSYLAAANQREEYTPDGILIFDRFTAT